MPEALLFPDDFADDRIEWTCLWTAAVMLRPESERSVERFLESVRARQLERWLANATREQEAELGLTAREISMFFKVVPQFDDLIVELRRDCARSNAGATGSAHYGELAGYNLILPLAIAAGHNKTVGRGASQRLLKEVLQFKGHPWVGTSRATLSEKWQKYASVAHLWAAMIMLRESGYPSFLLASDSKVALMRLLVLAEMVREASENHRPERAQEPLLKPGTAVRIVCDGPIDKFPDHRFDVSFPSVPVELLDAAQIGGPD